MDKVASLKYNLKFPYWYYCGEPEVNERTDLTRHYLQMEDCDIVLRRSKSYLDGLIFSQNSYFTHAGLYHKRIIGGIESHRVLHATGSKGVEEGSLEEFCRCDDVAILRFSLKGVEEEADISRYINDDLRTTPDRLNLRKEEADLFNDVISKTKLDQDSVKTQEFEKRFRDIVLNRALSLIGAKYDFYFKFDDFKRFSCIEYVWYCFKSLFPFHRIRVKDFEYFNWIVMPVIVPDVFIKNDFFEVKWTSLPGGADKKELKRIVKESRNQFWLFLKSILLWSSVILIIIDIIYIIKHNGHLH